ncbi:MAG: ferrochelatase [Cytophagales bacterium]|nr:ferrochelatase [Cytophagales bacterium]
MYQERKKTAVLLVNTGTPDSPQVKDVRKYLREFLMDKRVIDIPFLKRFFLVNFIIAPFRALNSAKLYKQLWTEQGSPLLVYGNKLVKLLQQALGEGSIVCLAMRYQNPGINAVLDQLKGQRLEKIIVIPLFPQYASASTGSVNSKVMEIIKTWQVIPEIRYFVSFYDHPLFIKAFVEIGKKHLQENAFDHILFSYHGLPERQIKKADQSKSCLIEDGCCAKIGHQNKHCYRAQCFETSRLLAKALEIKEEDYTVCFQSRLGKNPWIKPYTDEIIRQLPAKGKKRVLAFAPSFVADCLETIIEVGEEYRALFEESGGEKWQMVESLNTHPLWVKTLKELVLDR